MSQSRLCAENRPADLDQLPVRGGGGGRPGRRGAPGPGPRSRGWGGPAGRLPTPPAMRTRGALAGAVGQQRISSVVSDGGKAAL